MEISSPFFSLAQSPFPGNHLITMNSTTSPSVIDFAEILADPKNQERYETFLAGFQKQVEETQEALRESVRISEQDLAIRINARE
jgi:hypothetical protein